MEFLTPSVLATIGSAVFASLISIQLYFLKSLNMRFDSLSIAIREVNLVTQNWLKDHEEKDQDRHIDNLYRFEKIAVALAKLGADNGTYIHNDPVQR